MRAQKKIAVVVMVLLTGWAGGAWGAVAATVDPGLVANTSFGPANSLGWRFFVDKEITITHLGLYDAGEAGLSGTHLLGIWRVKKQGGLRLERCVSIGPGGVAEDHHVYMALAEPLTIVPDPEPVEIGGVLYYERWLVGVWSATGSSDMRSLVPSEAATLAIQQAGIIRLENYTYRPFDGTPDTTLGDATLNAQKWFPWGSTSADHFGVNFKYTTAGTPPEGQPSAEAGPDVTIYTSEQAVTTIAGTAFHTNPAASMQYRWLAGDTVLQDWTAVGLLGTANLSLAEPVTALSAGPHTLTLEVGDGTLTASDTMTLTLSNTPPAAQPGSLSQVVELGVDAIVIAGEVADFDGDALSYQWIKNGQVLGSGTITPPAGGAAVSIEDLAIDAGDPRFPIGIHTVQLVVNDNVNPPVTVTTTVEVKDMSAPTLTPTASTTLLWPPDGKLRPVTIWSSAVDNGGGPITLTVTVQSNECGESDWSIDSVDSATGVIQLRLRAERVAQGDGRAYTITIAAADQGGNQTSASVEVRVPHDQRKKK